MNLATDTHPLLWLLDGSPRKLSRFARSAFAAAEEARITMHVPVIVLAEIVLLESLAKIDLSYSELVAQLALRPGFSLENLTPEDIDSARTLAHVRDPFDRLIAATASRLGVPLLTADEALEEARGVTTRW